MLPIPRYLLEQGVTDMVRISDLDISDDELASRRSEWRAPEPRYERGYGALYQEHITQADEGCDFDFLARPGRDPWPDPS
jgi:dihydroxyacid dehydratase/phosphogluconate dehydratase